MRHRDQILWDNANEPLVWAVDIGENSDWPGHDSVKLPVLRFTFSEGDQRAYHKQGGVGFLTPILN